MSDALQIPGPKSGIFGFKNVVEFQKDPIQFLTRLSEDYGDIVHFKFGPQYDVYLLVHPEYVRELLVKRWQDTIKWEKMAAPTRKVAPSALPIIEGDEWKIHRKLVAPAFHTQRIKEYAELMVRHTTELINGWEDGGVYKMHEQMVTVTMGIIGEILFDIEDIEEDAPKLTEALRVLLDMFMLESTAPMPVPDWVPTPRNLRENEAGRIMQDYLMNIIQERRESGEDCGDVLSALLFAVDEEGGGKLSNEEVRDELYGLFVAGHDTTTIMLMWALYVLATNPDLQEQLYQEVNSVIQDKAPTLEELDTMTLTDRILQETMRMYPSAWSMFLRTAINDVQIGDHTIPKGGAIWVSPYVLHHDKRWWDNPDQFDPARFEGEWRKKVPNYAFMPFGGGPRVCVGSHLAEMEAEVILATIVKNFVVELEDPNQHPKVVPHFTLHSHNGVPLRVRKRQ